MNLQIADFQPKVSLLVPVYNVADCIERCLRTLFEQTLDDIEFIFVDDGSTDDSCIVLKQIAEQYPQRKGSIRLIHRPRNLSLGTARKTAVEAAAGEYIIHIDSDDYIDRAMCEVMYNKAKEGDYDMVWCAYDIIHNNQSVYQPVAHEKDPIECLLKMAVFSKDINSQVWNKMIRRSCSKQRFQISDRY